MKSPIGQAPEWVREAWIGIEMPVYGYGPKKVRGYGVIDGPWKFGMLSRLFSSKAATVEGYPVAYRDAVAALRGSRADAADWWDTNMTGSIKRGVLLFDSPACEEVS